MALTRNFPVSYRMHKAKKVHLANLFEIAMD